MAHKLPVPPEPVSREQLILAHMHLAETIAAGIKRRLPPFIRLDDCISEAYKGLVEAADKYHPETKVPFSAYARRRIAGAVIDSIRRRNFKHTATLQLSEFPDQLRSCRVDTIPEVEAGVDGRRRRERTVQAIRSLPDPLERRMLSLRYFHSCQSCDRTGECLTCPRGGMTGKAAGKVIGIREAQSSQIHRQAVSSLRRALQSAPHFDELKAA